MENMIRSVLLICFVITSLPAYAGGNDKKVIDELLGYYQTHGHHQIQDLAAWRDQLQSVPAEILLGSNQESAKRIFTLKVNYAIPNNTPTWKVLLIPVQPKDSGRTIHEKEKALDRRVDRLVHVVEFMEQNSGVSLGDNPVRLHYLMFHSLDPDQILTDTKGFKKDTEGFKATVIAYLSYFQHIKNPDGSQVYPPGFFKDFYQQLPENIKVEWIRDRSPKRLERDAKLISQLKQAPLSMRTDWGICPAPEKKTLRQAQASHQQHTTNKPAPKTAHRTDDLLMTVEPGHKAQVLRWLNETRDNHAHMSQAQYEFAIPAAPDYTRPAFPGFLANYMPVKKLGEGTYGQVYTAYDMRSGSSLPSFVVKISNFNYWNGDKLSSRSFNIIDIVGKNPHPCIAEYSATYWDDRDRQFYEVLKRYPLTVADMLRHSPYTMLNENTASAITYMTVQGLAYINRKGWAHRDMKPANCAIDFDGSVKIFDFGISRPGKIEANEQGALPSMGERRVSCFIILSYRDTKILTPWI